MSRRTPVPVAGAVQALAARLAPATPLGDVQRVWAAAVGPAIAAEAEPIAERDGTVTVLCASAVWMAEIDLMGPELAAAVNRALGTDRVRALRCTATRGRRRRPEDP
jgi:predicted nucleic acid-binding Zn ribbon protein